MNTVVVDDQLTIDVEAGPVIGIQPKFVIPGGGNLEFSYIANAKPLETIGDTGEALIERLRLNIELF